MNSLFDPADPRPLHFLGISGAGMSALALAARRRGVPVTGTDRDPNAFDDLRAAGAIVSEAPAAGQIASARAVVVTAAAASDHPDLQTARQAGVAIVPRKEALAALVNGTTLVAIAGTHGKTTTTVMTTEALRAAGMHPSGLAGGRVASWGGNAWLDGDELFVVEADEYDQAFLTLRPTIAVINNVEADHLECYTSLGDMEGAFVSFASHARQVLVGDADGGSRRVAEAITVPVWRFGTSGELGLRLFPREMNAEGSVAEIALPDGTTVLLRLQVPGLHNLRNATAAIGVVFALDAPLQPALDALAAFTGVGRRFERLGESGGITFVDDYAHHPTEMVATIAAARQAFPQRRLVAAFQPHLYSRTREHGVAMGIALAAADVVIVSDVYAAREVPLPGVDGAMVADAALAAGAFVFYQPDRAHLANEAVGMLRDGDVFLTMGAGDITRLGPEVRTLVEQA